MGSVFGIICNLKTHFKLYEKIILQDFESDLLIGGHEEMFSESHFRYTGPAGESGFIQTHTNHTDSI